MRSWTLNVLIVAALTSGCTHVQLRRNTVNQMSTVHDLQQQQVLDNLAMFVHNRGSYPYFSMVLQGTSTLTDTGSLAVTDGWLRAGTHFLYNSLGVNPSASRVAAEAWTINPVNDSVKLTLMRCCYRIAVDGCMGTYSDGCPDCQTLLDHFYSFSKVQSQSNSATQGMSSGPDGAHPTADNTDAPQVDRGTGNAEPVPAPPPNSVADNLGAGGAAAAPKDAASNPPVTSHYDGIVTPDCIRFRGCWFCYGRKVPKRYRKCCMVGHYCGTYVWVPQENLDELTKLTILIQDIAYYSFPPPSGSNALGPGGGGPGAYYPERSISPQPYTTLSTLQILRAFSPSPLSPVPGT